MKDPVIDRDGNSYEKSAILIGCIRKNESPLTRKPLRETDLTPNRALKDQIEVFRSLKEKESKKSEKQEEDYDTNGYVVVDNDALTVNLAFQDAAVLMVLKQIRYVLPGHDKGLTTKGNARSN